MSFRVDLEEGVSVICGSQSTARLVEVMVKIDGRQSPFVLPYWSLVWENWAQAIGKKNSALFKSSVFEILFTGPGTDLSFIMVDTETWQRFIACVIELIYFERITGILGILEEKDGDIEVVLVEKLNGWTKLAKEAYADMKTKAGNNLKLIETRNREIAELQKTLAIIRAEYTEAMQKLDETDRKVLSLNEENIRIRQQKDLLEREIVEENARFTGVLKRIDLTPKVIFISFIIKLLEDLSKTYKPLEIAILSATYVDTENRKVLDSANEFFKKFLAKLMDGEDKRKSVLKGLEKRKVSIDEALIVLETLTTDFQVMEEEASHYFKLLDSPNFGFNERLLGLEVKIGQLETNIKDVERERQEETEELKSNLEKTLRDKLLEITKLSKEKDALAEKQRQDASSVSRLELELRSSKAEFDKLKTELQEARSSLTQQSVAFQTLSTENKRLEQASQGLKAELVAIESLKETAYLKIQEELQAKTAELIKTTGALSMTHTTLTDKENEIRSLKEARKTLEATVRDLKQASQTTTITHLSVEEKKKEFEKQIALLERERDEKKRDYDRDSDAMSKKLAETANNYEKVREELKTLQAAVSAKELLNSQKDSDTRILLENKTKEYKELESKLQKSEQNFEKQKEIYLAAAQERTNKIDVMQGEIKKLKSSSEELTKKNEDLRKQLDESIIKKAGMDSAIRVQDNVVKELQNRIASMENSVREQESRLRTQGDVLRQQSTSMIEFQKKLDLKTAELAAAVGERDNLLGKLGSAEGKIESIKRESAETAAKLEKEVRDKSEELSKIKQELETKVTTKIKELKEIKKAQANEIRNLTEKVNELKREVKIEKEKAAEAIEKANEAYKNLEDKVKSKSFFSDAGYMHFNDFKNEIDRVFGLFFRQLGADVAAGDITQYLHILGTHITGQSSYLAKVTAEMNSLKNEIKQNQSEIAALMLNKERATSLLQNLENELQELRQTRSDQEKNIENLKETIAWQKDFITKQQNDLTATQSSTAEYASNLEQEARTFVAGRTELIKNEANEVLNLQIQRINDLEARLVIAENLAADYAARENALLKIELVQSQQMKSLTFTMQAKTEACMQILKTVNQKSTDLSQTLNLSRVQEPGVLKKEKSFERILEEEEMSVIMPIQAAIPKQAEVPKELNKTIADIKPAVEEMKEIAAELTDKVKEVFAAQPAETQKAITTELNKIQSQTPTADLPPQIPLTETEVELNKSEKELAKAIEAADVTQAAITSEIDSLRAEKENILSVQPIMEISTPVGVDPSAAKAVQSNILAKANALPKYTRKVPNGFQTLRGGGSAFFDNMSTQEIAEFGMAAMQIAAGRPDAGKFMGRQRNAGFDPDDSRMQEESSYERDYRERYEPTVGRRRYGGVSNPVY